MWTHTMRIVSMHFCTSWIWVIFTTLCQICVLFFCHSYFIPRTFQGFLHEPITFESISTSDRQTSSLSAGCWSSSSGGNLLQHTRASVLCANSYPLWKKRWVCLHHTFIIHRACYNQACWRLPTFSSSSSSSRPDIPQCRPGRSPGSGEGEGGSGPMLPWLLVPPGSSCMKTVTLCQCAEAPSRLRGGIWKR